MECGIVCGEGAQHRAADASLLEKTEAFSTCFTFLLIKEITLWMVFTNGASIVFLFIILHLGRAISYASYSCNTDTSYELWVTSYLSRTNELMRSYSNYKVNISISIFIEWFYGGHYIYINQVLCFSFSIYMYSLCIFTFQSTSSIFYSSFKEFH